MVDVNMVEKVGPHEAVVRLGMTLGQGHVFIHVEGDYVLEANLSSLGLNQHNKNWGGECEKVGVSAFRFVIMCQIDRGKELENILNLVQCYEFLVCWQWR